MSQSWLYDLQRGLRAAMLRVVDQAKQLGEQIVKRKQEKINAFLLMLEDPDLQELVVGLRNGRSVFIEPPKHKFAPGLAAAIVALRPQLPKRFTVADVLRLLNAQEFRFNSSDHKFSVRNALFRMEKCAQVRYVQKGKGGRPSAFAWV